MRDRNKVPAHWVQIGEGAVRDDQVEVKRDSHYKGSPFVLISATGDLYGQGVRDGATQRPRLFRYLDAATATADLVWPLSVNHEPAFWLVANKDDWKQPIDAVIPADKLLAVVKAIKYFTGADTTVSVRGDGQMQVTSVGYYGVEGMTRA